MGIYRLVFGEITSSWNNFDYIISLYYYFGSISLFINIYNFNRDIILMRLISKRL